jgi:disulfide bond formation protein DsbB
MNHPVPLWPRLLALALPAALLAGAWISQLAGGLIPCEMCHWQRWPHYAALLPALGALMVRQGAIPAILTIVAALLVGTSGAIGLFHAGVEYGWWEGLTACSTATVTGNIGDLMNAPIVRCDVAPWTLAGISLAGYNALISIGGAALILWGLNRSRRSMI